MNLDLYEFKYHETKTDDGLVYKVQTDNMRSGYNITITENYYDCYDELECKKRLIYDLHRLKKELQQELEQRGIYKRR